MVTARARRPRTHSSRSTSTKGCSWSREAHPKSPSLQGVHRKVLDSWGAITCDPVRAKRTKTPILERRSPSAKPHHSGVLAQPHCHSPGRGGNCPPKHFHKFGRQPTLKHTHRKNSSVYNLSTCHHHGDSKPQSPLRSSIESFSSRL